MFSVHTGGASTNRRKMDTSAMFPVDGFGSDYADSPEVSPVRAPFLAANHPSNEIEALQQRLAHAQRQINTLKGTLQREKQLRMEYRAKLDATSPGGLGAEDEDGDGYVDEETVDAAPAKSATKPRTTTPFRVGGGRGGRGRGRGGRGGISLIQRLDMAAGSPSSEYNDDYDRLDLDDSLPPPVPPIPIRFSHHDEDDDADAQALFGNGRVTHQEHEREYDDEDPTAVRLRSRSPSPSPVEPPSNRTSVDGMDPAFANVLRRVPSNGSYTSSPLRQTVLGRSARGGTVGRRQRGGLAYKEARPPSLVEAPDVLAAELGVGIGGGVGGSPMKGLDIPEEDDFRMMAEVETAEFGCQTEVEEVIVPPTPAPPPIPVAPETTEMGVQAEQEPEPVPEPVYVPPPPVLTEMSMQTDDVSVVVVQKSDMGTQHIVEELPVVPILVSAGMSTDPEPLPVAPILVSSGVSTDPEPLPAAPPMQVDTETQTPPVRVVETADVDTQTPLPAPVQYELGSRRTTITQYDVSNSSFGSAGSSSGDTTITRGTGRSFLAYPQHQEEDEEEDGGDGDETETGADTETDTDDYHDARQSIMMSTPSNSESRDDFHSVMTMTDNDFSESEEEDDDAESIKASRLPSLANASMASSVGGDPQRPSSFYSAVQAPPVSYETVGVSADLFVMPDPVVIVAPPPPGPEVKEMSIQTDAWTPPVPALAVAPVPAPVIPIPTNTPGLYRVGSANQQFQFVAPPPAATSSSTGPSTATPTPSPSTIPTTAGSGSTPITTPIPTPLSNVFRESSATFGRVRSSTSDRRQSIESAISSIAADDGPSRSRVPSGGTMLSVVDKTRPPMMVLPPPPRLPPPSTSMLPPSFIPERRIPTNSTGSYDMPPPRPSSPPPAELIQRATTPTFGAVLNVPGGKGGLVFRQHGSSMPPSQSNLRQPPSTSSFRSAANAAAYAQHSIAPAGGLSSFSVRERERREFSTTSLTSERSMASPRSSMSSDHHDHPYNQSSVPDPVTPNKSADITPRGPPGAPSTDPAIIHAITQTMIGEFLFKYTRRAIGKGYGERRHRRFFWVHPYTKTLYWSSADPGSSNVSESSAKSGMYPFPARLDEQLLTSFPQLTSRVSAQFWTPTPCLQGCTNTVSLFLPPSGR